MQVDYATPVIALANRFAPLSDYPNSWSPELRQPLYHPHQQPSAVEARGQRQQSSASQGDTHQPQHQGAYQPQQQPPRQQPPRHQRRKPAKRQQQQPPVTDVSTRGAEDRATQEGDQLPVQQELQAATRPVAQPVAPLVTPLVAPLVTSPVASPVAPRAAPQHQHHLLQPVYQQQAQRHHMQQQTPRQPPRHQRRKSAQRQQQQPPATDVSARGAEVHATHEVDQLPVQQEQQAEHQQQHQQLRNDGVPVPVTLVVSDSMCAGIRDVAINTMLQEHSDGLRSDQVKVERHLGATADELRFYSKYNIQKLKPQCVVIVAGANDVSREDSNAPDAPAEIAHRIAQIAREAKDLGVQQVCVMGIVLRRDKRYSQLITRVNLALRHVCSDEAFRYIDNSFIGVADLQRDGLHVSYQGKQKLMHNILSCCSSYNPTYGYMWGTLNKWGVDLNC